MINLSPLNQNPIVKYLVNTLPLCRIITELLNNKDVRTDPQKLFTSQHGDEPSANAWVTTNSHSLQEGPNFT